jgi:hypothetical protein
MIAVATGVIGVFVGCFVGMWVRRVDVRQWKVRAVEMAKINNALMDRVELLEIEMQKES